VILAACGEGMDHHVAGAPYRTRLVGRVLASGEPASARTSRAIGCAVPECPLTAGVAAPIVIDGEPVAVLSAWRTQRRPLGRPTVELVLGLADVIAARLSEHGAPEEDRVAAHVGD
jgi:LytS/YehU family sensor histidine kinase